MWEKSFISMEGKFNWIKFVKAVLYAIISALAAIGTSQTAEALNLFH